MDHFKSLGGLGLGSRMKRMSDYLMTEVREIYRNDGADFDPGCFPLFSLLAKRKDLTVTEAAGHLKMTHPYVIKMAQGLENKGLLISKSSKRDKRSRTLTLTEKGCRLAVEFQPVWDNIKKTIEGLFLESGFNALFALDALEGLFEKQSLAKRVNLRMTATPHAASRGKVKVHDYHEKFKPYFELLNRQWLEKYFSVEDLDVKYFKDPKGTIVDKGGNILFAECDGRILGTCAIIRDKTGGYELAKMAVDEDARGLGIGESLMKGAMSILEKKSGRIYLVTNSRLQPAIRLYEKYGFVETFRGQHPLYKRGDVIMDLQVTQNLIREATKIHR